MQILRKRFPTWPEILNVFGVAVLVVYSWAIRGFLYQLSSLLLNQPVARIVAALFYVMAFALVESLLVINVLILLGAILPGAWLRHGFAYKGGIALLVTAAGAILLQEYMHSLHYAVPPPANLLAGAAAVLVLLIGLIALFQWSNRLRNILLGLEERTRIFLYLYLPLGLIGWLVVAVRNLR